MPLARCLKTLGEALLESARLSARIGNGKIVIEVVRSGDPEDEAETAVVFRNLTLTALEGGEPGRAPTGP